MAIAQLSVDLIASVAKFDQSMREAVSSSERTSRKIEAGFARVGSAAKGVFTAIVAAGAGYGVASLVGKFVRETREAQEAQAQLAAVLESTGQAAGFSAEQLNKMADQMAGASVFDDDAINRAQTRLLSYTGIVGGQFPKAMQATIDMAQRMGMSVEQSAETVGRALDIPSQGLTSLTRQGFRFTDAQRDLVKQLEATGRVGEAQAIVLDALNSSYGGAARAARDTFGGALLGLQNQLNNLMQGEEGGLTGATAAVNELTATLSSAQTKEAFASLTSALAKIIEVAVTAGVAFTSLGERIGRGLASITGNLSEFDRIQGKIKDVEATMRNRLLAPTQELFFASRQELETMRRDLLAEEAKLESAMQGRYVDPRLLGDPGSIASQTATFTRRAPGAAAGGAGGGTGKAPKVSEAERYLENLQKQLEKTYELSVAEQVLADIAKGRLGTVTAAQQAGLLDIASQIDAAKALTVQRETETRAQAEQAEQADKLKRHDEALQAAGKATFEATRTPVERLNIELIHQQELLKALGPEYRDTYDRAVVAAQDAFDAIRAQGKAADDFTKELAKNVQTHLGDGLYQVMQGNFKNIGDSFLQMLQRMAADALAADLARKLFGGKADGGTGVGWFGQALTAIGGIFTGGGFGSGPQFGNQDLGMNFAVGTNYIPYDGFRATLHKGEAIVPAKYNPAAGGERMGAAPSVTYFNANVNVTASPGMSRQTAMQQGVEIGRGIQHAMARGA